MPTRDTGWRQGDVLTDGHVNELGLTAEGSGRHAIIITHDCDLCSTAENLVEVITGLRLSQPDRQLIGARNPRRLHLRYTFAEVSCAIELRHADRCSVSKTSFSRYCKDQSFSLSEEEKRTLKQWLAARYGRPAFPDAFEARLRRLGEKGKKTVEQQIARIIEPASTHLVGVFFDLEGNRAVELPEGEPYPLSITIAYDGSQGRDARNTAEQAAASIRNLFEAVYGRPDLADEIALDRCEAVADTSMTLADIRRTDQWRLEYISLTAESDEPSLLMGGSS